MLAVFSGVLLLVLALVNQGRTGQLQKEAGAASAQAFQLTEQMRSGGETVRGLGMRAAALSRLAAIRGRALDATIAASDRGGAFSVTTRTLRLFFQSMMLGLGAWLAIRGAITPGIMIAAAILLGRALAPIDQAVAQWPVLQRALEGYRALSKFLSETPEEPVRIPLPAPDPEKLKNIGRPLMEAENVYVGAPGAERPAVRGASFQLHPGNAVGIAGVSAAGKSTLARALAGVWTPLAGRVTLGGAGLDQYGEAALARHLGWLPQEVVLFQGTVAENISRLDPEPDAEAVIEAARRAGAHEMILSLPGGYDFQVAAGGAALSGGQRQRIALARAFYGDPVVVVLDEPDAHLDAEGAAALRRAVTELTAQDGSAVIVAHNPRTLLACDMVWLMEDGRLRRPEDSKLLSAVRPAADGESVEDTDRTERTESPGTTNKQVPRSVQLLQGPPPWLRESGDDSGNEPGTGTPGGSA